MEIDAARLQRDVEELGQIGRTPDGGVSRTSFSADDRRARAWLTARCEEAGLSVRTDGLGNLFATRPGPAGPAVWTGSHIDSVPNGGQLDGALGTLTSLECLRRLHELGVPQRRPLTLVAFSDEEGCYHSLLGSVGVASGYDRATLEALTGREGDRLVDALAGMGFDQEAATTTKADPGEIHAYLELHIEQGAVLEQTGDDIGIVTGIVGLGHGALRFTGRSDHAGTTPMTMRRDALQGAVALIAQLPGIAAAISERAVVTCGRVDVAPGSSNVVPGEVLVNLDFRHPDPEHLDAIREAIVAVAEDVAASQALEVAYVPASRIDPVPMDLGVQQAIEDAAIAAGARFRRMPSGAGHDAQQMATLAPAGMIFVPSADGRSHSPAEHTPFPQIVVGANVMLRTLAQLVA